MRQKRLIVTSVISIILVSILFIGSTFSVFTTSSPDEEINSYKTGNLDVEVVGEGKTIDKMSLVKEEDSDKLTPYHISVHNKGTVPYQFNVILDETTTSDAIDRKYIMMKIGVLDAMALSEIKDNILKSGVVALPGETVEMDIRFWLSDQIQNTEINKSFFAKIRIEGEATQNKNSTDNSTLVNPVKS